MPEFKILIKLAKWYLDMLQPLRRTLSHMPSVALLRSQNCLNTITNFKKKKIFPSYTIVLNYFTLHIFLAGKDFKKGI